MKLCTCDERTRKTKRQNCKKAKKVKVKALNNVTHKVHIFPSFVTPEDNKQSLHPYNVPGIGLPAIIVQIYEDKIWEP